MLKYWRHLAAAFVACLVMVLLAQPAEAAGGQQGAFTYELKGNGTAVITKFDWSKHSGDDVYVPRMIDGYTVTEIGDSAFTGEVPYADCGSSYYSFRKIENRRYGKEVAIVLPDTITVIGDKAFMWTRISACNIPASVKRIGVGAFAGCCNIQRFTVTAGNQTYAVIDGVLFNKVNKELIAFPLDYGNDNYTIPNGIHSVGDYAFYALGESSKFSEDEVAQIDVFVSSTVTSIGDYAFACSEGVNLSNATSLIHIGNHAFDSCLFDYHEKYNIVYPQTIGAYAFKDASSGYFMNFSNLRSLGEGAFYHFRGNIRGLEHTHITEIPDYAFFDCEHPPMQLPNTVTNIGEYAFAHILQYFSNDSFLQLVIPASVTNIEQYAFYQSEGTISFAVGSNLRSIGAYAFCDFRLTQGELHLPDSLTTIGEGAFYNFEGLPQEFTLPASITHIGPSAFYSTRNTAPSLLTLPDNVTEIGENIVDRTKTVLQVTPGSYAEFWASENGYPIETNDTSWLFE